MKLMAKTKQHRITFNKQQVILEYFTVLNMMNLVYRNK